MWFEWRFGIIVRVVERLSGRSRDVMSAASSHCIESAADAADSVTCLRHTQSVNSGGGIGKKDHGFSLSKSIVIIIIIIEGGP